MSQAIRLRSHFWNRILTPYIYPGNAHSKHSMVETDILVGMIGTIGAFLAASIPYYLTKRNEIAMNIQKTKLERYDDLLQKFVLWLQSKEELDKDKSAIEFIMAYDRASSYASAEVLTAIEEFISLRRTPIEESGSSLAEQLTKRSEKDREKINKIFIAIREDIQPTEPHFNFHYLIHPEKLQR
jgi:hypothetical protein